MRSVGDAGVPCFKQGASESSAPAPKVFPRFLQEPAPLLAGFKMVHLSIVGESVSVILDTVSVTDRFCFF